MKVSKCGVFWALFKKKNYNEYLKDVVKTFFQEENLNVEITPSVSKSKKSVQYSITYAYFQEI